LADESPPIEVNLLSTTRPVADFVIIPLRPSEGFRKALRL